MKLDKLNVANRI